MTLLTEQDTPEMKDAVEAAFKSTEYWENASDDSNIFATFEHGRWWVTLFDNERDDVQQFSVVDAEGPGSFDGLDFEGI